MESNMGRRAFLIGAGLLGVGVSAYILTKLAIETEDPLSQIPESSKPISVPPEGNIVQTSGYKPESKVVASTEGSDWWKLVDVLKRRIVKDDFNRP